MGGHKSSSHTTVKTEYKERPMTEEEKQLLREEATLARKLGNIGETSEARSNKLFQHYMQTFAPLELSMVGRVLRTNNELGKVDQRLLNQFQAAAKSSVYSGAKGADKKLKQFFAQRGLEGSGLEAEAMAQLQGSISKSAASALQQAFFQALEKSDIYRQQRLQNIGQAISVGKGFSSGGFGYLGLAGQSYSGASSALGQTFSNWDKRWKQSSFTDSHSSSRGSFFSDLGNIVSITKAF